MKSWPRLLSGLLAALALASCTAPDAGKQIRLRHIRQLTSNGTHAEAYWSYDGRKLILMAQRDGDAADQIYSLDPETKKLERLSAGKGKTTCAYWLPDGNFIYSSTHHHGDAPPTPPDRSKGYIWPLYRTFDIFLNKDGRLTQLTNSDGYDAEATVSPDGRRIVFTSHREGGIGLWTMRTDGTDLRKVNHRRGYAGGAFFSPDGTKLVYRAFYPAGKEQEKLWQRMLNEHVLPPVPMEIYISNADGSDERQVTRNGKVNFAPAWHPDGNRIIFTSDMDAKQHGHYSLYLINSDGTGLQRITHHDGFDGFPHFSPDGQRLVWISNRNATKDPRRELDVFIADWTDPDDQIHPPAKGQDTDPQLEVRIKELIRNLAAPVLKTRDQATNELIEIGTPALHHLQKAAQSSDAEIRTRIRKILEIVDEIEWPTGSAIKDGVQLTLKSKKADYTVGDEITVKVRIHNTSDEAKNVGRMCEHRAYSHVMSILAINAAGQEEFLYPQPSIQDDSVGHGIGSCILSPVVISPHSMLYYQITTALKPIQKTAGLDRHGLGGSVPLKAGAYKIQACTEMAGSNLVDIQIR